MNAPGWLDFDAEIVDALYAKTTVDREPDGGMPCPLLEHDAHTLGWKSGDYAKGTASWRALSDVRVSPTYILDDPLATSTPAATS